MTSIRYDGIIYNPGSFRWYRPLASAVTLLGFVCPSPDLHHYPSHTPAAPPRHTLALCTPALYFKSLPAPRGPSPSGPRRVPLVHLDFEPAGRVGWLLVGNQVHWTWFHWAPPRPASRESSLIPFLPLVLAFIPFPTHFLHLYYRFPVFSLAARLLQRRLLSIARRQGCEATVLPSAGRGAAGRRPFTSALHGHATHASSSCLTLARLARSRRKGKDM